LQDTSKPKIAVGVLINQNRDSLKINPLEAGVGVYSGLYILSDCEYSDIKKLLHSFEFIEFVKSLRKYKSGNYYTFSSKDLQQYLNYMLSNEL